MEQIILVCGKWSFQKCRWLFVVDAKRGSRMLGADDSMNYENFIGMVFEDFGLDNRVYDVKLSYMFHKKIVQKLPQDTPPVYVENYRQFKTFLGQSKAAMLRLCVEVKDKMDMKKTLHDEVPRAEKNDEDGNEDDEDDDESRFDYCDDSDGTDSGDENFSAYGIMHEKEEEKEEEEEEEEEEKPILPIKKRASTFYVSEGNANAEFAKFQLSSLDLAVGQCYDSKEELETRMKILTVVQKFDFNVVKSTPELLTVKCWVNGCSWRVRATPIGDYPRFHVRQYIPNHTCSVTERSARSRQATHEILGLLYKDFVGGVGPTVLPMHVADALNKRFQIKLGYWKAYRTLRHARDLVRGTHESGYELLPAYLYMIKRENPGSHTRLEVDENKRFKYLFLAFSASINGFPYMRKVVVVDGTFLQGKYKGTLLTATAQDGNFQIFPIAYAVVDTENDESWVWFFEQLSAVIPDDESLAIISDRHKSIGKAIRTVYPKSSRGICTYHLYKNILVRFRGREAFSLVKKAANAFRLVDFQTTFNQIQALNPALRTYLERADVRLWTRVHFPGDRYNLLTSNIAESMNKVLSQSRKLPIVQLLEVVRSMMTRWFDSRRTDALKLQTTLTRGVEKLLEVNKKSHFDAHFVPWLILYDRRLILRNFLQSRVEYSKLLNVQDIDANQVQVIGGGSLHVVNLRDKKCSCRRFDLERLPCTHAIAAAEKRKMSRISLCHPYYHRSYLYNSYSTAIMPRDFSLPIPEHVAAKVCLPPIPKQQPGRPKKSRMKSVLEIAMQKKRPRKQHTCGNCNEVGHNRKTCKIA